jgi:hypothetical protein
MEEFVERSEVFPRQLSALEQELLQWVLPGERPGYAEYRRIVETWDVAGRGRRGEGNYILMEGNGSPDVESPLPQVLAYGALEMENGELSVSVRERLEDQVEFEISWLHGEGPYKKEQERRRWTLSTWLPQTPCPKCGVGAREVPMESESGQRLVLAICARDKRLWIYDAHRQISHPIPPTNFYNELMLHMNERDPKVAFDSNRLFSQLSSYSDLHLLLSFRSYNQIRTKVHLDSPLRIPRPKSVSLLRRLTQLFHHH